MKKLALFTLLILLQQAATAQTRRDTKEFSYGFKAAWNIANILHSDMGDSIKTVAQHKLAAGGFVMYRPFDDFAILAELLYSQQGCNLDRHYANTNPQQEDIGYTNDLVFELQYLNLPILINWYVPIVTGLAVKSGMQLGFLLDNKLTYRGEIYDTQDYTKSVDISVPIGLSYEFDFGIQLDIRYNMGLTDVVTIPKENADINTYSSNISNTNGVWQFALGVRF